MQKTAISNFINKKIKICGIRNVAEAKYCEKLGIDFIGLNFVSSSKRFINEQKAQAICSAVKKTPTVGIFQNQSITKVNRIAQKLHLHYIQLSGNEPISFVQQCCKPVIKTINIKYKSDFERAKKYLPYTAYILLDGASPGSGNPIPVNLKKIEYPFFLAGGIAPENVEKIVANANPLCIDIASGIETNGKIDLQKIKFIHHKINPLC